MNYIRHMIAHEGGLKVKAHQISGSTAKPCICKKSPDKTRSESFDQTRVSNFPIAEHDGCHRIWDDTNVNRQIFRPLCSGHELDIVSR